MELQHQKHGEVDVVQMPEKLLMANAGAARATVTKIIEVGDGRLVIDLAGTEFMDSSGLAVVVSALKAAQAKGGEVHLASMSDSIRALFQLTQVHKLFQIFDNAEAAVASFART